MFDNTLSYHKSTTDPIKSSVALVKSHEMNNQQGSPHIFSTPLSSKGRLGRRGERLETLVTCPARVAWLMVFLASGVIFWDTLHCDIPNDGQI